MQILRHGWRCARCHSCWSFQRARTSSFKTFFENKPVMSHPVKKPSVEYIILIAMLSSIVALGSDIMLPGLSLIGSELGAPSENSVHYNIILFFLGFAFGQLVVGPLSDSFGRKPI